MSWRAGIEQNARVSSMKPDVREKPAVSVTARAVAPDRLGRVEEPPRRADVHATGRSRPAARARATRPSRRRVNTTRWKPGVRAEALEQRAQRVGELDPDRDVVPGVGPERARPSAGGGRGARPGCSVITSPSSHDIRAISSSMCRRNATASAARGLAGERRAVDARRLAGLERVGAHVLVAVVGRDRAVRDEVPPPRLQRAHVAGVVAGVDVRRLARAARRRRPSRAAPARGSGRAGTSGSRGPDQVGSAASAACADEVVARVVGGGEHRDPEALVAARAAGRRPRPRRSASWS